MPSALAPSRLESEGLVPVEISSTQPPPVTAQTARRSGPAAPTHRRPAFRLVPGDKRFGGGEEDAAVVGEAEPWRPESLRRWPARRSDCRRHSRAVGGRVVAIDLAVRPLVISRQGQRRGEDGVFAGGVDLEVGGVASPGELTLSRTSGLSVWGRGKCAGRRQRRYRDLGWRRDVAGVDRDALWIPRGSLSRSGSRPVCPRSQTRSRLPSST